MKTLAIFLILNTVLSLTLCKKLQKENGLPSAPSGKYLKNHYGTIPKENHYGPTASLKGMNIVRSNKDGEIQPIGNYDKEIDIKEVASGSLENTSRDATKIINAELAAPKVHIETDLIHNAVVKTPVHIGNELERVNVHTLNRENGEVTVEKITTKKPILAVLETAKQVNTKVNTYVDISTGKIIEPNSEKKLLGTGDIVQDKK